MCKPMREKLEYEFESHFDGEKLFSTNSVKYLNIENDKYLDQGDHVNAVAIKLNRANAMPQ